jgi:hypothetical protein
MRTAANKDRPRHPDEAWFLANKATVAAQRPTNSHNRMIIGIGTPTIQSKSPRPIIASMHWSWIQERGSAPQVPAGRTEKPAVL